MTEMKMTRILAFVLTVVMIFSVISVCASAVYTGDVNAKLEDFDVVIDHDGANLTTSNSFSYVYGGQTKSTKSNGWTQNGTYSTTTTYHDAEKQQIKDQTFYDDNGADSVKMIEFNQVDPKDAENKVIKLTKHHSFNKMVVEYNKDGTEKSRTTTTVSSDSYYNTTLLNNYVNFATASVSDTNKEWFAKAQAAHKIYAGRSFIMSVDVMLGENLRAAGEYAPVFSIINTWVAGGAANSNEPVQFDAGTGEIYYFKTNGSKDRVSTGKFFTKDKYTSVAVLFQPAVNTYSLYIDGEFITTQTMMSTDDLAEILAGDATVDNKVTVNVDGLSAEEAQRKQGQSYLPTLFRFVQKYSDAYADNIRVYYLNKDTVNGHDLTIDKGVLGLNYYLDLNADVLADDTATVDFAIDGGKTVSLKASAAEYVDGKGYKFTVPVSSVEMAKKITMTIEGAGNYYVYKGGVAYPNNVYSVKEYAEEVIASEETQNVKDLATAMLNYGAYAQTYFAAINGGEAGELPLAAPSVSGVTDNISNVTIAGPQGSGIKAALILDSNTSIVIYNAQGEKIGEKTGINTLQLDEAYEIDCGTTGKVTVSVLAIGEKVLESQGASEYYKNLIKALKLLSDASAPFAPQ